MADAHTTYFGFIMPEVGASRDTWGAKTNSNWAEIDQFLSWAMPVGAILDFAGPTAPPGWLICDGRLVSRTTYSLLFSIISTYWGAGDGSTTFALPPTPGRASVGPGTVTDILGNSYGFGFTELTGLVSNQITQLYLPNYAMATDVQGWHGHTGATSGGGGHSHVTDLQGVHSHGGTTWGTSNDHTHGGSTDYTGDHSHTVPNTVAPGGAALAAGAFSFGGNSTTSTNGAHTHALTIGGQSADHNHAITQDPGHTHTTSYFGDHIHGIYPDGNHAHNVWMGGSGQLFEVLSPVICVTKIIYAGWQGPSLRLAAAAAPARRLSAPLRGSH